MASLAALRSCCCTIGIAEANIARNVVGGVAICWLIRTRSASDSSPARSSKQSTARFMVSVEVPLAECAARSAEANLKLLDFLRRVVLACYVFISFLRLRCVLPV